MKINRPKGTNDYFGYEIDKFRYIEKVFRQEMEKFGAQELLTPIFEDTLVFTRSVGDSSDIVNKEMYTFEDKSKRSITLRPEGTAPIVRALVENKIYATPGIKKLYYLGPNFRYERPQSGRMRQFHQFGLEVFGEQSAYLDADLIYLVDQMIKRIKIKDVVININTIGRQESRQNYLNCLKDYFQKDLSQLCGDCQNRYLKNPLRILDCKVDQNHPLISNAPKIIDYLIPEDRQYFESVLSILDQLGVKYQINDRLVRGLDYYCDEVFELIYQQPNSPLNGLVIGGGGRYNDLPKIFDGPDLKAIGFGLGMERLMLLIDDQKITISDHDQLTIALITIGEETKLPGLTIANQLRLAGIKVEIDYHNHNLKPQFKMAERANAQFILMLGQSELDHQEIIVKNTISKTEEKIAISNLVDYLNNR